MIKQETIVKILLESEIGSYESDGTRSSAGHINRSQYHDVADKIIKLVKPVIKSICAYHDCKKEIESHKLFCDEHENGLRTIDKYM